MVKSTRVVLPFLLLRRFDEAGEKLEQYRQEKISYIEGVLASDKSSEHGVFSFLCAHTMENNISDKFKKNELDQFERDLLAYLGRYLEQVKEITQTLDSYEKRSYC